MLNCTECVNRIKQRAKSRGVTMTYLCDMLGKRKSFLTDVRNGNDRIKDDQLAVLADFLCTTVDYLKGVTDDPEGKQFEHEMLRHAKGAYFFDENTPKEDLEVMTRSIAINTNLRGDVEKAKIIERISSLDTETLLKLEKILDMILEEK